MSYNVGILSNLSQHYIWIKFDSFNSKTESIKDKIESIR